MRAWYAHTSCTGVPCSSSGEALPVASPTCAASSLAFGRASEDVGFELGLGAFESAKARTGYVRRVMGVWRAIDGWGAGRMARHLEAVRRDMRGGIAGCVVELSILRAAQNYSESWLEFLKPSISGSNLHEPCIWWRRSRSEEGPCTVIMVL